MKRIIYKMKVRLIASITTIIVLSFLFLFKSSLNNDEMAKTVNPTIQTTKMASSVTALITEIADSKPQPNNEQIYDSFLDFPYDNMRFVSDDIYESIKEEYYKINFSSEFKLGNLEVYDLYKEKFKQLLDNERVYTDKKGNEFLLNEFLPEAYENTYSAIYNDYDVNNFEYYFFDMDEDDSPELCIVDHIKNPSIYIFKYIPDKDKIFLWYEMTSLWIRLNGSKTLGWNREGTSQVFYKLDENGDEVYTVSFFEREDFNRRINQAEVVYLVALPDYTDRNEQIEITEQIREQAYYDRGQEWYYFRVSEEQYHELTKDYFKAEKLANENIETVSYSYYELFNK